MDRRRLLHVLGEKVNAPAEESQSSGWTTPFVGRDDELRHLATAQDLVARGQGRAIFLTGQPGIGKTRLAREALGLASKRGFTVLEGHAYPLEVGLAYAPILGALNPLLRKVGSARLAILTSGLPDLGRLFSGLRLPAPPPLDDPSLERTRLFEAILRLIERVARRAPVALFVDDLHWADPATLQMLHYVARGLPEQRVLGKL
ncbi:MAG: ATP-binding protein [Chloroflexi bacterium]|nr:ATP-binding protein [Chloroflexota bacterium]